MSIPLVIAISPYHLATREAPALCALLLADQVVTLMPTPEAGPDRAEFDAAVRHAPRFLRFMERIRWSVPLWNAGLLSGGRHDEDVAHGLRDVYTRAADDDALVFMRQIFDSARRQREHEFLDHVCADLLKGGPDPAVCIPVAACIDEFSARHGMFVARAAAVSVAQRAEAMMHRRLGTFAMPILAQASGRRLLDLRERLHPQLAELRRHLVQAVSPRGDDPPAAPLAFEEVAEAARSLTAAFERARVDLVRGDDDSGRRVMDAYVSASVVEAPTDAVFRSSLHALRSATAGARAAASTAVRVQAPVAALPRLTSIVVKPLHLRPTP